MAPRMGGKSASPMGLAEARGLVKAPEQIRDMIGSRRPVVVVAVHGIGWGGSRTETAPSLTGDRREIEKVIS
jgi:hypothetical protein